MTQAKELALTLLRSGNSVLYTSKYLGEHSWIVREWAKKAGWNHTYKPALVGSKGEVLVVELLCRMGFKAIRTSHSHPYDIDVEGLRLEVKTSSASIKADGNPWLHFNCNTKRFSLPGYTYSKNYQTDCDFLVAVWLDENIRKLWIIPSHLIPKSLHLNLNYLERGKYVRYENRFDLLSEALDRSLAA